MLFKVFLFARNPGLFHLKRLAVFKFDFCLLKLDLLDYFLEVLVDLVHRIHFPLFHFCKEFATLFLQVVCVVTQVAKILYDHITVLFEDIN